MDHHLHLSSPRRRFFVGGIALTVAASAVAQTERVPGASEITLGEQNNLASLVELCAEQLNLNIEFDAEQLRKSDVTLRLGAGVTEEELWTLTNRLLAAHGWTTVRMPGESILSVVELDDAQQMSQFQGSGSIEAGPGFVSLVLRIKEATPEQVLEAIRPLLSVPGGHAIRLGSTNCILVSDLSPRLRDVAAMIDMVEANARENAVTIERIDVLNYDPETLVIQANAINAARETVAANRLAGHLSLAKGDHAIVLVAPANAVPEWRALIAKLDVQEQVITRTYPSTVFKVQEVGALIEQTARRSGAGAGDRWRVVVDSLTGSLIVTATATEHEDIEELMARLEQSSMRSRRPIEVFTLRNRSATEVLDVIQRLIDAGAMTADTTANPDTSTASTSHDEKSHGDNATLPGLGDRPTNAATGVSPSEMSVSLDASTNAIIAIGDPRALSHLGSLIESLDVRQSQVEIEIVVVALNDSDTLDLGAELQKLEVSGNTLIGLSSLFGLSNVKLDATSPLAGGRGFSGVILSPGDFSVVMRALEVVNRGSSRSYPKLLVNNNEVATLDSVVQQPLLEINASDTVATTSFAGTLDAGTQVTVTPHIAEGDHLVLEYDIAISAFVGNSSNATLPPPRQQTSIQSVVTIPDGFTVAVGGLEALSNSHAKSQVPVLGDIPGIGELFKKWSKSDSRSQFFVFIRGNILRHRSFDDLRHLSEEHAAGAGLASEAPILWPRVIY